MTTPAGFFAFTEQAQTFSGTVFTLSLSDAHLFVEYAFCQNGVLWTGEFSGALDAAGVADGRWKESALSLPDVVGPATLTGKLLGSRHVISGTWRMNSKNSAEERWVLDCTAT
jgi:hypothetical protein